ncbi:hypothetical protein NM06_01185 [Vibrio sinaloensis]|uniref:Uncharacterized protein n=1 Tax=Photobacterium sp. (strain ATCC 43367) TaxID=379097 RepID=A0A0A5HY15_PHOS4|nr:hypothetical protein NM06_01185 [Vibrio sinaloensis]
MFCELASDVREAARRITMRLRSEERVNVVEPTIFDAVWLGLTCWLAAFPELPDAPTKDDELRELDEVEAF